MKCFLRSACAFLMIQTCLVASAAEEDLNTPPVVTAKSWAIVDAKTGTLLWGDLADEPRKAASTAKMMCALVVLQMAEKDPSVLEEWVTFSKVASSTPGSTAGIKAGEKVKVRDCLYGLLLPSGNDAGNALAEHLNARLAGPDEAMLKAGMDNPTLKSRVNFIAEMSRVARQTGMTKTVYRSAYGDGGTDKDLTTTASDLCRLAVKAMSLETFRTCVRTRHHEAVVRTGAKSTRQVTWENSNALLALDLGYDGIKTGLTNQAGHCLVASAHRGGDHLYGVVLGSSSADGRYADMRNLFRWAWKQRPATP